MAGGTEPVRWSRRFRPPQRRPRDRGPMATRKGRRRWCSMSASAAQSPFQVQVGTAPLRSIALRTRERKRVTMPLAT